MSAATGVLERGLEIGGQWVRSRIVWGMGVVVCVVPVAIRLAPSLVTTEQVYAKFQVTYGERVRPRATDSTPRAQIPEPPTKSSLRSLACEILLSGGQLRVSQTFPPITEPLPIVMRPRMVAPA